MKSRFAHRAPPGSTEAPPPPSLTASALWLAAAKTISFGAGFALPLVLVRRLSGEEFGLYKQLFLVVNTVTVLLPLGFAMSAFYFWPREPGRRDSVVLHILLFHGFMTGVAGIGLARRPDLLARIFHGGELAAYANEIALLLVLWGASSILETLAVAKGEFRWAAAAIVGLNLSRVFLLLGAAIWAPSIATIVKAALLHGVLQMIVLIAYLVSRFGAFWLRFDPALLRSQLSYALPHGLAAWLYWIHMDLHNYFVAHFVGAAEYAVYAVGCFQLPFLVILNESVGAVAVPRASRLQGEHRSREILSLVAAMTRKLAILYFPVFAFLLVHRREFISALFTSAYLSAVPIFAVNLTLVPLAIVGIAGDAVLRADAEHRFFLVKLRLGLTPLTLTGLAIGTQHFGLLGAIFVVAVVSVLERAFVAAKVRSILEITRRDLVLFRDLVKAAGGAAVAAFASAGVRSVVAGTVESPVVVLLACALTFGAVYAAAIVALRVPRPEETAVLRTHIRNWWGWRSAHAEQEPSR